MSHRWMCFTRLSFISKTRTARAKVHFPIFPHLDPFFDFHSSELADHVELLDFATLTRFHYA